MSNKTEQIKDYVETIEDVKNHYRFSYVRPYSSFAPEMKKVKPIPQYVSSLNSFKLYVPPISKISNMVEEEASKNLESSELSKNM